MFWYCWEKMKQSTIFKLTFQTVLLFLWIFFELLYCYDISLEIFLGSIFYTFFPPAPHWLRSKHPKHHHYKERGFFPGRARVLDSASGSARRKSPKTVPMFANVCHWFAGITGSGHFYPRKVGTIHSWFTHFVGWFTHSEWWFSTAPVDGQSNPWTPGLGQPHLATGLHHCYLWLTTDPTILMTQKISFEEQGWWTIAMEDSFSSFQYGKVGFLEMGIATNGDSPMNGWLISWKILSYNGWFGGTPISGNL